MNTNAARVAESYGLSENLPDNHSDTLAVLGVCIARALDRGARRVHFIALFDLTFGDDSSISVLRTAPDSCRDSFKLLNFALLILEEQSMPKPQILSHLDSILKDAF